MDNQASETDWKITRNAVGYLIGAYMESGNKLSNAEYEAIARTLGIGDEIARLRSFYGVHKTGLDY